MNKTQKKKVGSGNLKPISINIKNINYKLLDSIIKNSTINTDEISSLPGYNAIINGTEITDYTLKVIQFCIYHIYNISGNNYIPQNNTDIINLINKIDVIPININSKNIPTDIFDYKTENDKRIEIRIEISEIDNISEHIKFLNYIFRFIEYIYKYELIKYTNHNYDNIILLYCSYSIFNNIIQSLPVMKLSSHVTNHTTTNNTYTIKSNIKGILGILYVNMKKSFLNLIQDIIYDLIYTLSPYNIFNKYLIEHPINVLKNVGIMQICILLYSTAYTRLQNEILTKDLTKNNTFDKTDSLKDIIESSSTHALTFKNEVKLKSLMDPIQSYLLFLYDPKHPQTEQHASGFLRPRPNRPEPPRAPLINKYEPFFKTNDYTQLAQTINTLYGLGINFE